MNQLHPYFADVLAAHFPVGGMERIDGDEDIIRADPRDITPEEYDRHEEEFLISESH